MKKLIIIMIAAIGLTIGSCKKLEDFNKDGKSATAVPSSTLFANALRNLVDQETTPSVNKNVFRAFAQYWTET
ncbi:MAG TPA: SusD/RagB family nutrient-binding outer membrane lipoprotein, partial [Bacteroidia bacterium]|nr:SusD/RagB family nutrient-binding outer membrane lipoprotein [Bacteroidia bacterium]